MNIGNKAPFEAGAHTVLKPSQLLWGQIAGDDNLLVVVVKRVEGMKKSFLGGVFTLKKLDVINEQNVDLAVSSLEFWSSVIRNCVDEIVGELFGADISHAAAFKEADGVVADGVEKVCFA